MFNFKYEPSSFLAANPGGVVRRLAIFLKRLAAIALVCALGFTLSTPSLAQAEDLQISSQADEQSVNPTLENTPGVEATSQSGDGLEIGPEIIGQPLRAVAKPTVNDVFAGDKTVSGKITIGSNRRKRMGLDVTIHVTVNRQAGGTEEKTVTIPSTITSQDWTVTLDSELAVGDKVTVKQEYNNEISAGVVKEAKKSLKDKHKDELQMPSGEIWIEQTVANIVNAEEQAEALRLVKEANPTIAGDISSVELKIYGTSDPKTAKINVTYTDGTTSGEIEAPGLIVKQVTEYSIGANISDITVVDNVIKGKLQGNGPFKDIKVQIYTRLSQAAINTFNNAGGCKTDKDSSKPVEVSVDSTTGEFTYTIPGTVGLPREQVVGVSVKEKNKFVSCGTSTVILATPQKTEVRDPKKLTDQEKDKIREAIRKANTVNGTSKLPDGTGFLDDPAFIEFDKDGNVTIISPNDVVVTWDSNYNPVYVKNPDGTYKLQDGKENNVIKFPAKDLVKNIAPKSPGIAVDTDKGEVTITPPAYKDPGDDTDLASYTITYKDASDADKTVTLTRTVDTTGKTTWSSDGATVDANTGVVTLQIEDLAVGATITAKAKDNGGLEGDTDELESAPASKTLETVTVSYDSNGGSGNMASKKLNKGSKYTILNNAFTAPDATPEFKAWEIDGREVAPGTEIKVTKNTVVKALWKTAVQKLELTVDPSEVTIVKGSPMLKPMNVEAHSTSVGGPITLQTICQPEHNGAAGTDKQNMPSGVDLMDATQDLQPPTGYNARATAKIDGNANQADVGTYRCWVYASLNGITIGPDGNATGSGTTLAEEGVNWARQPITVHVVEFVLPKTGVLSLNYVAGYAALLIVALTGVGYLRQNRREKSTA